MKHEDITKKTSISVVCLDPLERISVAQTSSAPIEIFSTCPESSAVDREIYVQKIIDPARWSEEAGCKEILVCSDNSLLDAWLVSHIIIQNTKALCLPIAAHLHASLYGSQDVDVFCPPLRQADLPQAVETFLGSGIEFLFMENILAKRRQGPTAAILSGSSEK